MVKVKLIELKVKVRSKKRQTGIKCVSVAAALRAEQGPRESSKDCISKQN